MLTKLRAGRLRTTVAVLTLTMALVAGFSVGPWATVSADSSTEMINCPRYYSDQAGSAVWDSANGAYYGWTSQKTIPSSSQCEDINLGNLYGLDYAGNLIDTCGDFRVRFYPSSGGSYTNSWKHLCSYVYNSGDPTTHTIATDVLNGTKYRVEFKNLIWASQDTFWFTIWH